MNTNNNSDHFRNNTYKLLDKLHYKSLFFVKNFKIDSSDNLHITELSVFNKRKEIISLELISPLQDIRSRPSTPLLLLALASGIIASAFFASVVFAGQLWAIAFTAVFSILSISTLFASYKNSTTLYDFRFSATATHLFTLSEPFTENKQVEKFVNALNKRITSLTELDGKLKFDGDRGRVTAINAVSDKKKHYDDKYSQYITHVDFLFNHGIVDAALYKRLQMEINNKIAESENLFTPEKNSRNQSHNIIDFPVNA